MVDFSTLMSLYDKENTEWFKECMDSILNQTAKSTEIVLVEDGELPQELEYIVQDYESKCSFLKVIRCEENRGLGVALNEGLKHCSYDLVARMDTDDVASPDRFEKQLKVFEDNPDLDLCSAWISEFQDCEDNVVAIKKVPENHAEIFDFGKSRNPVNHPVVMFKKDAVLDAGGYQHCLYFEDYWLWVRMLMKGCKFYNIQESLLLFRTSSDMYLRRGGMRYFMCEIDFLKKMRAAGYISSFQFLKNLSVRLVARVIPNKLRAYLYQKLIRTN